MTNNAPANAESTATARETITHGNVAACEALAAARAACANATDREIAAEMSLRSAYAYVDQAFWVALRHTYGPLADRIGTLHDETGEPIAGCAIVATGETAVAADLSTQTPVQIDTRLAELHAAMALINRGFDRLTDRAHFVAGDSRRPATWGTRRPVWEMTFEATWERVESMAEAGDETRPRGYAVAPTAAELVAERDALRKQRADNLAERKPLVDAYAERNWTRYFVVTSSAGHVHGNVYCSRRDATVYGWMPEYSGRTVEEMIAELGPVMCTKCYPSAPLSATTGKLTKTRAADLAAAPYVLS